MVFSSLLFLFRFLPVVLAAYYIMPRRFRNLILFLGSLVFYAWGEPIYVFLILCSVAVDYTAGRVVAHCLSRGCRNGALATVVCSVVANLGLLCFFKYSGFVLQNIHRFTGLTVPKWNPALPVGISFYTFQTMSYTIDVYRGEGKVQKNFITFGTYVALFPQLIAGPIVRYRTIAGQMERRRESVDLFWQGILRFMTGLGKKVLIANQVGMLWEEIAAMETGELTVAAAWLGVLAFTFQIYFDFSGYSDMAIGLGKMFGFTFPENFDYPYEAKSITEFWRRWHISLGTWFREYVYIPLGGGRKGGGRHVRNIAIVWLLTGLWHGASWSFILWGVYYAVLLVMEKRLWHRAIERLPAILRHLYTMFFVMLGWSLFAWQDMVDGAGYMKAMFGQAGAGGIDGQTVFLLISNLVLLVLAAVGSQSAVKRFVADKCLPEGTVRREIAAMLYMIAGFVSCTAMLMNSSYNPFLYFRF